MKRSHAPCLALLFLFCFLFVQFSAFAADYLSVPACYVIWARYFYEEETDEDISTSRNSDNLTVTSMDKISTFTNPETLTVEKLSFMFYDNNVTYSDAQLRTIEGKALAFFSAIEGGNLLTLSEKEVAAATGKAEEIYYDHVLALTDEQYDQIWKGDDLPFYTSESGTYYMSYEYHSRYVIYFVPAG